jgi:hypothetical protein
MYNSYLSFDQTFQLAYFLIELNHRRIVSRLATESIGTRTSCTVLALLASASVKRFRNCSRSIYYPMISLSSSETDTDVWCSLRTARASHALPFATIRHRQMVLTHHPAHLLPPGALYPARCLPKQSCSVILFQKSPWMKNTPKNYLAKLLSLRQEELVLRLQKFILMAGISVFFLQLLNDVPWGNGHRLSKRGDSDWTHLSPAISSRTELGIESCRVEDGDRDSLPVC